MNIVIQDQKISIKTHLENIEANISNICTEQGPMNNNRTDENSDVATKIQETTEHPGKY